MSRRCVLADVGQCLLTGTQQYDLGGRGQPSPSAIDREGGLDPELRPGALGDPAQRVFQRSGLKLSRGQAADQAARLREVLACGLRGQAELAARGVRGKLK